MATMSTERRGQLERAGYTVVAQGQGYVVACGERRVGVSVDETSAWTIASLDAWQRGRR